MKRMFHHTVSFEGCDACRSPTFISNVPRCMRPTQILAQNSRRSGETSKPLCVTSSDIEGILLLGELLINNKLSRLRLHVSFWKSFILEWFVIMHLYFIFILFYEVPGMKKHMKLGIESLKFSEFGWSFCVLWHWSSEATMGHFFAAHGKHKAMTCWEWRKENTNVKLLECLLFHDVTYKIETIKRWS